MNEHVHRAPRALLLALLASHAPYGCGDVHGLDPEDLPIAHLRLVIDADVEALGLTPESPLYAAILWSGDSLPDPLCLADRTAAAPELRAVLEHGCPPIPGFTPIGADTATRIAWSALTRRQEVRLAIMTPPELFEISTYRRASVVVFLDRDGDGALRIDSFGVPPPVDHDLVLATSIASDDPTMLVYRANPALRLEGCADSLPRGFSLLPGFDALADGPCRIEPLPERVVRLTLADGDPRLRHVACRVLTGRSIHDPRNTLTPDAANVAWACLSPVHLVTADVTTCPMLGHVVTRYCGPDADDHMACAVPLWSHSPPSWWPCGDTPPDVERTP